MGWANGNMTEPSLTRCLFGLRLRSGVSNEPLEDCKTREQEKTNYSQKKLKKNKTKTKQ
jgi:hypothetical protein